MSEATYHIRRAAPGEVHAAGGREGLQALGLVAIGSSTSYVYLFAPGSDLPGLTGEHVADDYAALSPQVAGVVMEAIWEGPDQSRGRGKRRDQPNDATLVATRPPLLLLE